MPVLMLRVPALPLGDRCCIGRNTEKTINHNKLFILVLSFPQSLFCNRTALIQGPQVYRHLQTEKLKQWQGLIDSIYTWLNSLKGLEMPGGYLPMCLQAWSSDHVSEHCACIPGFANEEGFLPFFVPWVFMDSACNALISPHHKSLGWWACHKPFIWGGKPLSKRNCRGDPKWFISAWPCLAACFAAFSLFYWPYFCVPGKLCRKAVKETVLLGFACWWLWLGNRSRRISRVLSMTSPEQPVPWRRLVAVFGTPGPLWYVQPWAAVTNMQIAVAASERNVKR